MSDKVITKLGSRNIKPTPNRILVLDAMMSASSPVSLADLECILETVDKSSIFRTMNLFLAHHLVHVIDDGSGSLKYEVCTGEEDCSVDDMHVHFYCERCHRTICLSSTPIPPVGLPDGFVMNSANYIVKGVCGDCMKKNGSVVPKEEFQGLRR